MSNFKKIGKLMIPAAMILLPVLAFAALPDATIPVTGNAITLDEIERIINDIAKFLIVISIVVAVIFIIIGAIIYIAAAGSEDGTKKGKAYMFNGFIGAAVVLAIGVLLQTMSKIIARTFF